MKRATWIVAVVCIIVLVDLVLFGLYIPPLVWHAGHGNYVEMKGVRYRLPLIYLEHSTVRNELYISTTLHRFPRKIAEITFSSILAAHVEWEYVGNDAPSMLADRSVFVPGQWLNVVLLATPDALAKERNSYQTSGEYERQVLLTQLLAGYTV